jgi:3-hydroxybutyryl-CoA dehydrogenase
MERQVSAQKIGVIGAGTMGSGIAQACAQSGLDVTMLDISEAAVAKGLGAIGASLDRLVKKEKIGKPQRDEAMARVRGTTVQAELAQCGLVIEAATENLDLKRKILAEVGAILGADAILATNTSSISITGLAAAGGRPQRFVGMHFFNPVPMMELVEVIRGLQTSDSTYAGAMDFAVRLGKRPIAVRNMPGFAVNRILCPMLNEAVFALQEGVASPEDIDTGMKLGCNHPIGPLALADMIGLDVLLAIMDVLHRDFGDPKYRAAPLLREMVSAGTLGRKSGAGFFKYG